MQWYATEQQEVLRQLAVEPSSGLRREEAHRRLIAHGPNELQVEAPVSPWQIFLGQFKNILIVILLFATALSVLIGELFDAGLILVIVLFSAGLGFFQEYRAEKAVEALKKMLSPVVSVLREGEEMEIPAREVVLGDVLLFEAGDRIPADARVLDAHVVKMDEAPLTGESVPVEKQPATLRPDTRTADCRNMVFTGTVVVHGRGRAVVVATGMQTEFGKIARDVGTVKEEKTPLERRTEEIGKWLGAFSLGIVFLVVLAGLTRRWLAGTSLDLNFAMNLAMFAIALAVAAVPEALAGIVTGTLAMGMQKMARSNALVRKMPAVEGLGSVTVICSDKTGTITKGEMTVRRIYARGTFVEVSGVGYEPTGSFTPTGAAQDLSLFLKAGALCNDALLKKDGDSWHIHGDPTEGALVVLAEKAGTDVKEMRLRYPRTGEIPFSSERKRMSTVHETPEGNGIAFMKGAAEVVLERCTSEMRGSGPVDLDEARIDVLLEAANTMAADGLRVLAVASRPVSLHGQEVEVNMTLLGLVGMIDPARQESIAAVKACREIGIRPVMITGDHRLTAVAVAREVGIYKTDDLTMTGAELESLSMEAFEQIVDQVSVYARVSPTDKMKIVTAWKKRGEIVAMTGDGVNDAPALKHADIGVAMGITGTEVAKEASDMVLADDNFATILKAVEMGRVIYDNIKKYLVYLLRANIVEVIVIGGVVLAHGAERLPLLPAAILYVNLVTDGLPAIALGFSPPEPDVMSRPPRDPHEHVFSLDINVFILLSVLISPVFFWVFFRSDDLLVARTDLFFLFVLVELAMALNLRSLHYSILKAPPHSWLLASVVASIAVTVVLIASPDIRDAFGVAIPSIEDLEIVLAIALLITGLTELTKMVLRRAAASSSPTSAETGAR